LRNKRSSKKCNCTNIFIHFEEHEEFRKMQLHQHFHPFEGIRRVQKNAIAPIFSSVLKNKKSSENTIA
jgi:hypothetical protein